LSNNPPFRNVALLAVQDQAGTVFFILEVPSQNLPGPTQQKPAAIAHGSLGQTVEAGHLKNPQRALGEAHLTTKLSTHDAGRNSRLDQFRQQGCCKIRLPQLTTQTGSGKNITAALLEAVMINSSGGLTGGDRLDWRFKTAANTALGITTQACERAYKSNKDTAKVTVDLTLEANSQLNWFPQETILFDGSALERNLTINMAESAKLCMVEPIIFGRQAMGENLQRAHFRDRWQIRRDGHLVHSEAFAISKTDKPKNAYIDPLLGRHSLDGNLAVATVLLVSPDAEDKLEAARAYARAENDKEFLVVSAWNGKLLARLLFKDAYTLRKSLIPLLELLNDGATMPKAWSL